MRDSHRIEVPVKAGSGEMVIRPACARDRKPVLAFCEHTFGEWGDYLPQVWEDWMRDPDGLFFVAEMGKKPIGVGKITVQRPGEIWLEGLRVDPALRGRGISRIIQDFVWEKAMSCHPRVIRYATGSYNKISQHLGMSSGMKIIAGFDEYVVAPTRSRVSLLESAAPDDLPDLERLFLHGFGAGSWRGLFLEGWTAKTLDETSLEQLVRGDRVWVLREEGRSLSSVAGRLRSACIVQDKGDSAGINICRVAYRSRRDLRGVLDGAGRKISAMGKSPRLYLPRTRAFRGAARENGWKRALDIWMVVLEWRG